MKIMFIDTETTGVDVTKHAVIQIAGILYYIDGNTMTEKERFNFNVRPFRGELLDPKAMEVNGKTREDLENYPSPTDVYLNLVNIFKQHVDKFNKKDKFFFAGYNARFDYDFLRSWFEKNGDPYFGSWFFFPPIDVMNLAAFALMEHRAELPNFKLGTVAEYLGVTPQEGNLHDALVDIETTIKIVNKLKGILG